MRTYYRATDGVDAGINTVFFALTIITAPLWLAALAGFLLYSYFGAKAMLLILLLPFAVIGGVVALREMAEEKAREARAVVAAAERAEWERERLEVATAKWQATLDAQKAATKARNEEKKRMAALRRKAKKDGWPFPL